MRTLIAILTTIALTAPSALALTDFYTPASDPTYVGEEADPVDCPDGGCPFAYPYRYGPLTYPDDATGIPAALEQTDKAPVMVLNHKWDSWGILVEDVTAQNLLYNFAFGHEFIGPWSQPYAFFGHFTDLNEDAFIQNDAWESGDFLGGAAMYTVSLDPVSVTPRENTIDGSADDEWAGIGPTDYRAGVNNRLLVTYQTGYGYGYSFKYTEGTRTDFEGVQPEYTYIEGIAEDGYYVGNIFTTPAGGQWGTTVRTYDGSILVTNVFETFVGLKEEPRSIADCTDKVLYPEGCRAYSVVEDFPYDVDVHQQLDDDVTTLYVNTVLVPSRDANEGVNTTNGQIAAERRALDNLTEQHFNDTWYGFLKPILVDTLGFDPELAVNDTSALERELEGERNRQVGAADDVLFPATHEAACMDDSVTAANCYDYTDGFHPYLDIQANYGFTAPLPFFLITGGFGINTLPNPNRDGTTASSDWGYFPGQLYLTGFYGTWHDQPKEATDTRPAEGPDGFITDHTDTGTSTNDEPAEGCPDLYDCGANDDPNEFADPNARGEHKEWKGISTSFFVDVYPDTNGRVWPGGAYVMGNSDPGGQDDLSPIPNDLTDGDTNGDGNPVDRLVLAGAIRITMTGDPATLGEHHPNLYVVLPKGSADFNVVLDTKTPNNGGQGLKATIGTTDEYVYDIDVLQRWT